MTDDPIEIFIQIRQGGRSYVKKWSINPSGPRFRYYEREFMYQMDKFAKEILREMDFAKGGQPDGHKI